MLILLTALSFALVPHDTPVPILPSPDDVQLDDDVVLYLHPWDLTVDEVDLELVPRVPLCVVDDVAVLELYEAVWLPPELGAAQTLEARTREG